ncbi:uncharacterized protein LAJ45_11480 [Morchella importuna]|uniref:uncharacterized protein n=1 Tax=Morchella importuna TaxID=1174673 RepID=UPI001E8DAD1D|nr:uncharacterized protein LAJ45_11480 [Morchella importuna]KAH8144505.1 hypothetical protein LAJ45_11480 [Morchella importuna]
MRMRVRMERICPAGLLSVFLSHSANPMGIVLIPDPIMYHQLPLILQGSAYHQWNDQSSYHESHGCTTCLCIQEIPILPILLRDNLVGSAFRMFSLSRAQPNHV